MNGAAKFIAATRRRYRLHLLVEGVVLGLTVGAVLAAVVHLLGHAFRPELSPWAELILILISLLSVPFFILRHIPSRATCAARIDDASHAGGLVLVSEMPGSEDWPLPPLHQPAIPKAWRKRMPSCGLAILSLFVVLLLPDAWFASSKSAPTPPVLTTVTAELKNEIEDLLEQNEFPADELEALREELARVEESADATDPAATLDAVERLDAQLKALLDLNAETLKRLRTDAAKPNALALSPETQQAFKDMIAQSGMGVSLRGEESPEGGEGDGEGQGQGCGEGQGDTPGSGGVGRGRDDAPMEWGTESEMNESQFADRTQDITPVNTDLVKVGESISPENPTADTTRQPAVSTQPAATGNSHPGLTRHARISPRHRGTVKRFFETERTTP